MFDFDTVIVAVAVSVNFEIHIGVGILGADPELTCFEACRWGAHWRQRQSGEPVRAML